MKYFNKSVQDNHGVVKEPEISYGVSSATQTFDTDFDNALQNAVSGDEFRSRMNKRIDSWAWNDK